MRRTILLAIACTFVGCDEGDPGREPIPLVEPTAWTMAEPTEDPFAHLRPVEVECDPDRGVYVEGERFEINTAWCNYATVTQPLLEPLSSGDEVELRLFHFELTGEAAEAYVALAFDGTLAWETTIPIPSDSELVAETFETPEAIEAGTPVQFHIHNHGKNTWEIVSIQRL